MKTTIVGINMLILAVMVLIVIEIDSDKGIAIFIFYYPVLVIVNTAIGWVLKWRDRRILSSFIFRMVIVMIVLFVPVTILFGFYA